MPKRQELARIESVVALCERCFGREPRLPVRFARPCARGRVLVLTERAPREVLLAQDRLGPENKDPATRFLRQLLTEAMIPEEEVVMGNALLCRARSQTLEKALPLRDRIHECRDHVRELVLALRPRLLVALGRVALSSLHQAFPEEAAILALRFPSSVGKTAVWHSGYVHVLYHTTPRARTVRPEPEQHRDWRALGEIWSWIALGELGPMPGRPLA